MGVDTVELLPDHSRLEFPSVFHIGALDWMPNQEGLLWFFENVWGKILEKHPDLLFYLAGRNAPPHFKVLPYPNVVYTGEVDNAYDFIRSKAVMIVPVLSGSGMRIKIIEGMALGKAIVTTSIGTEGIATTHGSDIFISDDPEEFARYVCSLIEDRNFCLKIGENASKFVKSRYDNYIITSSLVRLFSKTDPMIPEIIFWSALFLVLHTYVLYPVILRIFSSGRKGNLVLYERQEDLPFVSVIISAYQ